ncbi:MAG: ornithine carbamoyltransferase [Bacillota bacterium]|uniref:Ornithine carbamoyltransferase n=1 Tax=Thermanaerosceptrum fracticalcis TaxID=1712410 RepID=A0A7G6E5Z3_THEFR|nr:ornithine carbamoyltransferase [Thermanaerosceptrum fracticalcis]QNB47497.1 ornithine carbamoyltransferase [Thermanaerosceptrum fracticalcis]
MDLKGRDFLTLADFSQDEIWYLLQLARDLKEKQKAGIPHEYLKGKTLAMIFQKASTRTRVSFEAAMYHLGGFPMFLSKNDLQMGRGEPIEDTARVLSRYVDGIMIRTYSHKEVEDLARYASVPVINGLTDDYHPTQALADLLTIWEHKSALAGLKLAYIGDGNNMAHSLLLGGALMGMEVVVASPEGYQPSAAVVKRAKALAVDGEKIKVVIDPKEAVQEADVLYTDVWASMGQEEEAAIRKKALAQYQINQELLKHAKKDAIVMHCLPAHRGEEITAEVMEGPQSVVFDEAENRLHAHKAILAAVIK